MRTTITFWPSVRLTQGKRVHTTWPALFERFQFAKPVAAKADLPGWSPASFRGDRRGLEYVERLHALCFDLDDGTTFDSACAMWANNWAFVHTTFSHRADLHRLRVIAPLSRPVDSVEYGIVWRALARRQEEAPQGSSQIRPSEITSKAAKGWRARQEFKALLVSDRL